MKQLSICPDCSGYVPESAPCPHCRTAAPPTSRAMRLLKRSLMFMGAGAMTVTISACYGSPCASDDDCTAEPIDSIAVTGGDTVVVASNLQLTASATLSDATIEDVTITAVWTTNSAGIATVDEGLVTGISPGAVVITATQEGIAGSANVTVTTASAFAGGSVASVDP